MNQHGSNHGSRQARHLETSPFLVGHLVLTLLRALLSGTGSFGGILGVLLLIYLTLPLVGYLPMTIGETLNWFLSLEIQTILWTIGLIAGYALAVGTWRAQKAAEITLQHAELLEEFFWRFVARTRANHAIASALVHAASHARSSGVTQVRASMLADLRERLAPTLTTWQSLEDMAQELHDLASRTSLTVNRSLAAGAALRDLIFAVETVCAERRFIYPDAKYSDVELIEALRTMPLARAEFFIGVAEDAIPQIISHISFMQATLSARIIRLNVSWLANRVMLMRRKEYQQRSFPPSEDPT